MNHHDTLRRLDNATTNLIAARRRYQSDQDSYALCDRLAGVVFILEQVADSLGVDMQTVLSMMRSVGADKPGES